MVRHFSITLCLMLFFVLKCETDEQTHCPITCQCFTPTQVLCSKERMPSLPKILSKDVKELIVMTTSLTYLSPNTLQESRQLAKLVFLNNALQDIHARALENLTELEELDISGNPQLEHLNQGTFSKQGNLTKLQLNFNRITTLLPDMFDPLSNLESLQMKGNLISHLPKLIFRNLQRLRVLDLSQNKLGIVTRNNLLGLAELKTLKLNFNHISGLSSDTFHNVSQLTELSLEGNRLSHLPHKIFSLLSNLEVLNLRGNLLSDFSSEIIGSLPSSLKELTLKRNRLKELSGSSLEGLTSLTFLTLSTNQLRQLPVGLFQNLTALENLDLSENQLTSLPEKIFGELHAMKVLHLHRNNLTELDATLLEDQMGLHQLSLSDNHLQTLPQGLFDQLLFHHIVRLHGNPWQCDCQMSYLHNWVLNNSMNVEEFDMVLCKGPRSLRGRTIASIDRERLVCHLSEERVLDGASCTLQAADDTVIVRCKVNTCHPLNVKVEFQNEDGRVYEQAMQKWLPENNQCNNGTMTVTP